MSPLVRLLGVLPFLVAATASAAPAAPAQSVADLLDSIRRGGGWVRIPIETGSGTLLTATLPTLGLSLSGCAQVWGGHSGEWDIRARDTQGSGRVAVRARAGQPVPFNYDTGVMAQLSIDVRWSEPRDTTLLLWVGLDGPVHSGAAACDPVYAGARGGDGTALASTSPGRGPLALPPRRPRSMLKRPGN